MPNLGLSVSDVVNVSVQLTPVGAALRNFGSLLVLGDSDIIDTNERIRLYTSASGVAADFGSSAPEYLAAVVFFGQSPTPAQCYIGRWAASATHGRLRGGVLSAAQQALSNFTTVTSGGFQITIDGSVKSITGLNFSAQTTLNGVAAVIQAAFSGAATVIWDQNNACFWVKSASTGPASTVSFATAPVSGQDISGLLQWTAALAQYAVAGITSETIESAVNTMCSNSNKWYGLQIAATTAIQDADYVSVAGIIQAQGVSRIFGVTTSEGGALTTGTTDLAALMQAANYSRTFVQYSSSSPYASAAIFGIAFTVDFEGVGTTITLKFQQEAGIVAELLTETQAANLAAKNCNVFVTYNNATAIVQQGTMANGYWFDEVHGADWLQNSIQTDVYNLLYTAGTKIPMTDAGVNRLVATVTNNLAQAVANGFVAPGVWNGPPIGALSTGQTLSSGFYVFAPPVATQSQTNRNQRIAPTIQACIKLAGAIHFAGIIVSANQ